VLNSVFLHYAIEAGLDMAIIHQSKILPLFKIDEKGRELAQQVVFDERRYEGEGENRKVILRSIDGIDDALLRQEEGRERTEGC